MAETPNTEEQLEVDRGQVLHSWEFEEFPNQHRDVNWYVWAVIIGVALLGYAIFSANLLFGVIIFVSGLILALFHRTESTITFQITEDGLLLNKRFYPYKDIENFFIIYHPPEVTKLFFELKGVLRPRIPIPLGSQNPVTIRHTLLNYLPEDLEREDEPVSEQFSRMFKL